MRASIGSVRGPHKRGATTRLLVTLVVTLGASLPGCPAPRHLPPADLLSVMVPDRLGLEIAEALAADSTCIRVGIDTRDDTGTESTWLDSVARHTVDALRTRGIPAYVGSSLIGLDRVALLVSRPTAGGTEIVLEMPPGEHRRRWELGDRVGTPSTFLGRTWRPGPRVPIPVTRLRASTAADVLDAMEGAPAPPDAGLLEILTGLPPTTPLLAAEGEAGTHYLFPALDPTGLRMEVLGLHAVPPVPPAPPSPVMTEPLLDLQVVPESGGAYVAIDRTGHLWYGMEEGDGTPAPSTSNVDAGSTTTPDDGLRPPAGLWGPSIPGHGGGVALLEGLVVTSGPATEGPRDHLSALHVSHITGVLERSRVVLTDGLVRGMATLDLDGDGTLDLVVAHDRPHGTRFVVFLSGVVS